MDQQPKETTSLRDRMLLQNDILLKNGMWEVPEYIPPGGNFLAQPQLVDVAFSDAVIPQGTFAKPEQQLAFVMYVVRRHFQTPEQRTNYDTMMSRRTDKTIGSPAKLPKRLKAYQDAIMDYIRKQDKIPERPAILDYLYEHKGLFDMYGNVKPDDTRHIPTFPKYLEQRKKLALFGMEEVFPTAYGDQETPLATDSQDVAPGKSRTNRRFRVAHSGALS